MDEVMTAADLPAGLAEPLHILVPTSEWPGRLSLLALALLTWWLYHRWRRRRSPPPPAPLAVAPSAFRVAPPSDLARAIDALRRQTLESGDYRLGCHRLAELLRQHGERSLRHRLTVLTANEILTRLGDTPFGTVLGLLADLQFRRRGPRRSEVVDICAMARAVADHPPVARPGGDGEGGG